MVVFGLPVKVPRTRHKVVLFGLPVTLCESCRGQVVSGRVWITRAVKVPRTRHQVVLFGLPAVQGVVHKGKTHSDPVWITRARHHWITCDSSRQGRRGSCLDYRFTLPL